MEEMDKPTCTIVAGPNGAGKTTFAMRFLPIVANCKHFINADLIAAGLSPLSPEAEWIAASRLFLKEIKSCVHKRIHFAFETTLAGHGYLRLTDELQAEGWRVNLVYLSLSDVGLAKQRVAERVASGGHDIPEKDIARRFTRGLHNLLYSYSALCDMTQCFENSGPAPVLIFRQQKENRKIYNQQMFDRIEQEARRWKHSRKKQFPKKH